MEDEDYIKSLESRVRRLEGEAHKREKIKEELKELPGIAVEWIVGITVVLVIFSVIGSFFSS